MQFVAYWMSEWALPRTRKKEIRQNDFRFCWAEMEAQGEDRVRARWVRQRKRCEIELAKRESRRRERKKGGRDFFRLG